MSPATELYHVVNAYEAVAEWRADIVHDHTLVGPIYGRKFEVPVVTTNHAPFSGELGDYYRALGAQTPVVAISEHHAASALKTCVAAVIHHGINVNAYSFADAGHGHAVFLGRMTPDKGVDSAIRIARDAGVPLRIAAKMREPAELAYYRETVQPLLGSDVEFVGEVGGQDKLELLSGAMCLLNPLRWPEPFGMVMIEALACGTPVLATPCGAAPEIVREGITGYLRATEEGLAAALLEVGQIDRRQCRTDVAERFSVRRMVADHLALYQRVIDRRQPLQIAG